MAGWLSRATEAFRQPPAVPEPFNVACDCGAFVTGDRLSGPQRPSCRACGRSVFVLPANVYPAPKKRASRKATAKVTSGKSAGKTNRQPETPVRDVSKPERQKPTPEPASDPVEANRILIEPAARVVTPFRLVITAMLVIASLTGWGLWHRSRVKSAQVVVLGAKEAGLQALKDRDFGRAAHEFERARDAVDLLGRTDAEAREIRQFCREAVAGSRLAGDSFFEIVHEGLAETQHGGTSTGRFNGLYRGSWVLFDTTVTNPGATDVPCRLEMPMLVDGVTCQIEIDSISVRNAAAGAGTDGPARVIFAAQLDRVIPPSGELSDAILMLNGKTAFLWSHLETYAALGYRENDAELQQLTRAVLARQTELMEASK